MIVDLKAKAYVREKKGDIKRMRMNGQLPAIIYGHGEESKRISVGEREFKKVLEILQKEAITINIKIDKEKYLCVIKSIQHNPATDQLLHIDFQHVHKGEKIKALVPLHILGEAPGLKEGGILDQHLHEIRVRCLPSKIPSHIDVDISTLKLGDTLHLHDISREGVEFEQSKETPIISVLIPRAVVAEVKPEVTLEAEEGEEKAEGLPEEAKPEEETEKKEEPKSKNA